MLQSFKMDRDSKGSPEGLFPVRCRVPALSSKNETPSQLRRRISELLLLGEFSALVGTLLDPSQVHSAASAWLREVVKWDVLTVSSSAQEAKPSRYQVGEIEASVSKVCSPYSTATGAVTTNPGARKFDWSVACDDVVPLHFSDFSGLLAVSRLSVNKSQYSDEFLAGISGSLTRAFLNAHECDRLKTLSMRDHLTGLYNRRVFEAMLEVEGRKRTLKPFSLLLIDLDNLKSINDNYGHAAGDEALISLAKMLLVNFRKADVPARYGGDEFAVLLPEAPLASAWRIAERFRKSVAEHPLFRGDGEILPTVSVGVATVSDRNRLDIPRLVEEADQALYLAKSTGRNRVCPGRESVLASSPQ